MKRGETNRLHSVWDNRTGALIVADATSAECAKAMGIKPSYFLPMVTRTLRGEYTKYRIERGGRERGAREPRGSKCWLYSIWDEKTDELLILDGTLEESAEALGVTIPSLYSIISQHKKGQRNTYHIERRYGTKDDLWEGDEDEWE